MWHVVDDVCCQDKSIWLGEEGDDGYESFGIAFHDPLGGAGVLETVDGLEVEGKEGRVRGGN